MWYLLISLIIIICIDFVYLNLNKDMYKPIIQNDVNKLYAFLTWVCIILGIHILILSRTDIDDSNVYLYGFALGFSMYSVYNFTNAAIYTKTHNLQIIIIDTLWGTLLTGFMSYIMYTLKQKLEKL